jgi:hypothetical protein
VPVGLLGSQRPRQRPMAVRCLQLPSARRVVGQGLDAQPHVSRGNWFSLHRLAFRGIANQEYSESIPE